MSRPCSLPPRFLDLMRTNGCIVPPPSVNHPEKSPCGLSLDAAGVPEMIGKRDPALEGVRYLHLFLFEQ